MNIKQPSEGEVLLLLCTRSGKSKTEIAKRHRLTLECKDGRLRYTFSDLVIDHGNVLEYMENTAIKKHRKQYAQMSAQAAGSLEKAMVFGTSDW